MASTVTHGEETSRGPERLPPINPKQRYSRNAANLLLLCERERAMKTRLGFAAREKKPSCATRTPERLPLRITSAACAATTSCDSPRGHQNHHGAGSLNPAPPINSLKPDNPLRRFRKTARMVKKQIAWTKGLAKDAEAHLQTYVVQSEGDNQLQSEALTFNLNAFKPEVQSCGALTPRAKAILMKPSLARTKEDLAFLQRFTLRLKCFDRYPVYVRKELASVLYYEVFEKGRVVIREGDTGFNFYFIVSGCVLVEVQEEDQLTGTKHNIIMGELGSGSAFGELALLHDNQRRATIVCKEHSEFLTVDKPDFDMVLRRNHEREWETRLNHLRNNRFFKDWLPEKLNLVVAGSQIVEYLSNTVIIKDLSQAGDMIYFVISGNCKVVQKVELIETQSPVEPAKAILSLPPIGPSAGNHMPCRNKHGRSIKKWLVLRTLVPGDYFGMGEGREKGISVVSDHKVECLLVNKMALLKHKRGKCLAMMQEEVKNLYPTMNQAFQSYLQRKKWDDYKKKVVLETLARGPRRHLSSKMY